MNRLFIILIYLLVCPSRGIGQEPPFWHAQDLFQEYEFLIEEEQKAIQNLGELKKALIKLEQERELSPELEAQDLPPRTRHLVGKIARNLDKLKQQQQQHRAFEQYPSSPTMVTEKVLFKKAILEILELNEDETLIKPGAQLIIENKIPEGPDQNIQLDLVFNDQSTSLIVVSSIQEDGSRKSIKGILILPDGTFETLSQNGIFTLNFRFEQIEKLHKEIMTAEKTLAREQAAIQTLLADPILQKHISDRQRRQEPPPSIAPAPSRGESPKGRDLGVPMLDLYPYN